MPELISQKIRKAKKPHICDYCWEKINPGEKYNHAVLKYEGNIYGWDCHIHCLAISTEIWDMVDPDIGMTAEEFQDACAELCRLYICPGCDQLDKDGDCKQEKLFCTDKLIALMKTHTLERVKDEQGRLTWAWHFVPRKGERDHGK